MTWNMATDRPGPLTADDIERLLVRYDRIVINLIAHCKDRAEQEKLIDLWNDPGAFDRFMQCSADLLCEGAR